MNNNTGAGLDEPLDPRICIALEQLNKCSAEINSREVELDVARSSFRRFLNDSAQKLDELAKQLGSCVEKARPYYEARRKSREAQALTQNAAHRFELSCSQLDAAKEMVNLAEQGYFQKGQPFNPAWQEMLNHSTVKVNEAEKLRLELEIEHRLTAEASQEAEKLVNKLHRQSKRNIAKSRPYFETKAYFNQQMEEQKLHVVDLETRLKAAKSSYSEALRTLEKISEEIHSARKRESRDGTMRRIKSSKLYHPLMNSNESIPDQDVIVSPTTHTAPIRHSHVSTSDETTSSSEPTPISSSSSRMPSTHPLASTESTSEQLLLSSSDVIPSYSTDRTDMVIGRVSNKKDEDSMSLNTNKSPLASKEERLAIASDRADIIAAVTGAASVKTAVDYYYYDTGNSSKTAAMSKDVLHAFSAAGASVTATNAATTTALNTEATAVASSYNTKAATVTISNGVEYSTETAANATSATATVSNATTANAATPVSNISAITTAASTITNIPHLHTTSGEIIHHSDTASRIREANAEVLAMVQRVPKPHHPSLLHPPHSRAGSREDVLSDSGSTVAGVSGGSSDADTGSFLSASMLDDEQIESLMTETGEYQRFLDALDASQTANFRRLSLPAKLGYLKDYVNFDPRMVDDDDVCCDFCTDDDENEEDVSITVGIQGKQQQHDTESPFNERMDVSITTGFLGDQCGGEWQTIKRISRIPSEIKRVDGNITAKLQGEQQQVQQHDECFVLNEEEVDMKQDFEGASVDIISQANLSVKVNVGNLQGQALKSSGVSVPLAEVESEFIDPLNVKKVLYGEPL